MKYSDLIILKFSTSALATARIDIQASSSCKLSSTKVSCREIGVLGFVGVMELKRSNEILSDSSSVSSSNSSIERNSKKKVSFHGIVYQ